jgi:signal transduction histidine kinase
MRKDFVTSVSHDLKTPIGIIIGYAEGLKDGIVTGDDMNTYLETIIDEGYKMNSLVTSMVELSKLDSNDTAITLEPFNLVRLIKAMIKRLSREINKKNLNISFTNTPDYAYINADVLKMEQVIQNLLVNAIKYSPEGEDIYISIEEIKEDYHISIENTGVNIPNHELENVFAKFYRLDKSGDRTKNNFGLGLAIVKRILELHGSQYSIANTERGVLFKFTLHKYEEEFK